MDDKSISMRRNNLYPFIMVQKIRISRRRKRWIASASMNGPHPTGTVKAFREHLPSIIRDGNSATQYAITRCIYHWPHLKDLLTA